MHKLYYDNSVQLVFIAKCADTSVDLERVLEGLGSVGICQKKGKEMVYNIACDKYCWYFGNNLFMDQKKKHQYL